MELLNMDEALDEPTRLRLSGKTLALLMLDNVEVGAHFTLSAQAVAVAVTQERGADGETDRVLEVELHQIDLQPERPEEPEPELTREQAFYSRSKMA